MFPYISYILSCLFIWPLLSNTYNRNHLLLMFSSLYLFLLMGIRSWNIGTDTFGYCIEYLKYKDYRWFQIFGLGTNYGFYIYNKIVSSIAPNNYTIYLLSISLITTISIGIFLRDHSANVLLSQIMLLSLGFIYFFMTGIKQTLAISILLFAYRALRKRKTFIFILLCFLAATFHNTAIVFIIALPVTKIHHKKFAIVIAPILVFATYIFKQQIFLTIRNYLSQEYYSAYGVIYLSENNLTGLAIQGTIFIVALILLWRRIDKDEESAMIFMLYIVAMIFQAMTEVMAEFFRISMYFSIFGVILLPKALENKHNRKYKILLVYTIFIFVLYFIIFSSQNDKMIPYKWFGIEI